MKRVKKGDKYWFINHEGMVIVDEDERWVGDDRCYECGNYFTSRESAEAMAKKLRAVLKGADVIEMPSEEEINEKASELYPSQYNEYAGMYEVPSEKLGFGDCIDWLKSKIVK